MNCAITSAAIIWGSGGRLMPLCKAQMPAAWSVTTTPVIMALWPRAPAGASCSEEDIGSKNRLKQPVWPALKASATVEEIYRTPVRTARELTCGRSTMSSLKPKSGCLQRLRRMPCFALQNRGWQAELVWAATSLWMAAVVPLEQHLSTTSRAQVSQRPHCVATPSSNWISSKLMPACAWRAISRSDTRWHTQTIMAANSCGWLLM